MPALEFWELAEGRHAAVGIAVGDFPEERAVGLGLNFWHSEIGGFLEACAGGAVAFGAVTVEEFGAACCGVFVFGERIFADAGLVWGVPGGVLFVAGILGGGVDAEECRAAQK